ncbi:hypothetical protein NGC36_10310 [Serratia rubidaea]|uniref:hypothetical protein n=1 Tax=Serratia rubidaea TaxID=61652 RepID=UPI002DB67E4C|nr:hypothetical protein [Serratia rubidaea]MEB7585669.1 hypothetical protein [Serratia rubidaea]
MNYSFSGMIICITMLISACAPGPLGTKRYQPYAATDASVIYTQVNEKHQGLIYLKRFIKESDCYKEVETVYISNNLMEGAVNRLFESRIKPNQYWSIYVMDNSSGVRSYSSVAFVPEAGKRYVGINYRGVVEIPQELKISDSDDLDEIYEKYKNKPAKQWNVRDGVCKFWFAKLMGA